jgi:RNA 3'-terminal phosphate cyclase
MAAQSIAAQAVNDLTKLVASGCCVDEHTADQVYSVGEYEYSMSIV